MRSRVFLTISIQMKGTRTMFSAVFSLFLVTLVLVPLSAEPQFSPASGKQLDQWWSEYFRTSDTKNIDLTVEYENTDDLMLGRLEKNLDTLQKDPKAVEILQRLQIGIVNDRISSSYELDTLFGVLFGNRDFQDDLKYLFSLFPDKNELLIRCAVKSSAFWSLLANSRQHSDVKVYVDSVVPNLKKSSKFMFMTLGK
jgi:hypothetical protein